MNKFLLSKVTALTVAFAILLGAVSCKREELTLSEDNIDMTVNVFSEGVALPLGSIDTLTIKDLLASVEDLEDNEWFNVLESGALAISYKGLYDLSDSLNTMLEDFEIEPISEKEEIELDLKDVDVSDVKVDAMTFPEEGPYEVKFSEFVSAPALPEIPPFNESFSAASEIYKYAPDMSKLQLPIDPIHKESDLISVPDAIAYAPSSDELIELDATVLNTLGISIHDDFDLTQEIELNLSLPKGVTSVSDMILDENAGLKITVALENTFLQEGKITPALDVDLHHLLHLDTEEHDDVAHLAKDFVLTQNDKLVIDGQTVPFAKTKTYRVTGLVVDEGDWQKGSEGNYYLKETREVTAKGTLKLENLKTSINYIKTHKTTKVNVNLEFVNFEIADIEMGVDPVEVEKEEKVEVKLPETAIPEEIESIDWVGFDDNSVITINMQPSDLSALPGLDIDLTEMKILFPDGMEVEEQVGSQWVPVNDGKIVVQNESLRNGYVKKVKVNRFNLPALDENNKLSLTDYVTVSAKVVAGGSVNSAGLPTSADDDIKFDINVDGTLTIDDYQATIAGYDHKLDPPIVETIEIELTEDVKDLGAVTIYPDESDGEKQIRVEIDMPETSLDIHPLSGEGIKITLPDMVKFKYLDVLKEKYGYDATSPQSLNFGPEDEIPSEILLTIDKLVVVPELDETDGKYKATGEFRFDGGVSLNRGVVTKADVETLTSENSKVSVVAYIPEILPATVGINQYTTEIEEKIELDVMSGESLPKELVSIGRVELKDVAVDFSIDISSLTEYIVDADINVDIKVDFPKIIVLDEKRLDSEGRLHISETISKDELVRNNGIISIDPISVYALDLTGQNLNAGIKGEVLVNGGVSIANATVTDDLLGQVHMVVVNAGIDNITIDKVNARVDYQMEPMTESIDLSSLTEVFEDDKISATLDLNRFHILLELETDVAIPLAANIHLVPYFNGEASVERTLTAPINIKTAESVDEVSKTKIWIANNEEHKPSDCDMFIKLDLLSLIKDLPEKIDFSFAGGTDKDKDAVIGLEDDMTLKVDYEVALPFELGDEFEITYKETITDLDDILAQVFSYADLALTGEFVNGLPLELDVQFNLLDSEGNIVEMDATSGKQKIPSCALDGTASNCKLNIALIKKDGSAVTDISAIEVILTASSGDAAGVSLKETGFVTGKICVALPNGLTLDLGEISTEE